MKQFAFLMKHLLLKDSKWITEQFLHYFEPFVVYLSLCVEEILDQQVVVGYDDTYYFHCILI